MKQKQIVRNPVVQLSLAPHLKEQFSEEAKKKGLSESALGRMILIEWLEQRSTTN